MQYKTLPTIKSVEQVIELLHSKDIDIIRLLPLSVGDQCPESEKLFAQSTCLKLAESEDEATSSNAILGLAYIARRHGWLDKRLVEPHILKVFRENKEFNWRVVDAMEDINQYLGWRLTNKK